MSLWDSVNGEFRGKRHQEITQTTSRYPQISARTRWKKKKKKTGREVGRRNYKIHVVDK